MNGSRMAKQGEWFDDHSQRFAWRSGIMLAQVSRFGKLESLDESFAELVRS